VTTSPFQSEKPHHYEKRADVSIHTQFKIDLHTRPLYPTPARRPGVPVKIKLGVVILNIFFVTSVLLPLRPLC
jgi:hypothetical protein